MENAKNVGPRVKLAVRTYIGADVKNYVLNDKQQQMVEKEVKVKKRYDSKRNLMPAVPQAASSMLDKKREDVKLPIKRAKDISADLEKICREDEGTPKTAPSMFKASSDIPKIDT